MTGKHDGAAEVIGASIGNKAMLAGAGTSVVGGLTSVNWLGMTGAAVAILGLLVNLYFQHRRDKREAAESAARIEALKSKCSL